MIENYPKLIRQTTPNQRRSRAIFECKCGTLFEARISNVKSGNTKSCGCTKKKHGLYAHDLYKIWTCIKQRCYYEKSISYKNYGAKGVKMCEEWISDPEAFIKWSISNGWRKGLQIDKDIKANEKGIPAILYSPEMCQYITPKMNSNNRKNNHIIEYSGKRQTLEQWSEELGIMNETLRHRLRHLGWSVEKSITTETKKYASRKQ